MKPIFVLWVIICFTSCDNEIKKEKIDENKEAYVDSDGKTHITQLDDKFETNEASELNSKGLQFSRKGNYEKAKEIFLEALEIEGNNVTVLNNLGLVEMYMNNFDESSNYFLKSISLDSTYFNAHINYGLLLFEHEKYSESININEYVLKNSADELQIGSAHLHLSLNYHKLKECDKAYFHLEIAKEKFKDVESTQEMISSFESQLKEDC